MERVAPHLMTLVREDQVEALALQGFGGAAYHRQCLARSGPAIDYRPDPHIAVFRVLAALADNRPSNCNAIPLYFNAGEMSFRRWIQALESFCVTDGGE